MNVSAHLHMFQHQPGAFWICPANKSTTRLFDHFTSSRISAVSAVWPVVLLSGSGVAVNSLFNNLALMQIIAGLAPLKQIREVPVCLSVSVPVCHLVINDGPP